MSTASAKSGLSTLAPHKRDLFRLRWSLSFPAVPCPAPIPDRHPFVICCFNLAISPIVLESSGWLSIFNQRSQNESRFLEMMHSSGVGKVRSSPTSPSVLNTSENSLQNFFENSVPLGKEFVTHCIAWNKSSLTGTSPIISWYCFHAWQQLSTTIDCRLTPSRSFTLSKSSLTLEKVVDPCEAPFNNFIFFVQKNKQKTKLFNKTSVNISEGTNVLAHPKCMVTWYWPCSKFCHFLFVQRFKFLKMFQINVSKKSVWGKRKHQILIEKFKAKFCRSSGRRCAGQKGKVAFVSFTKWSEVHESYGITDLQKAHTLQNQSFYEV